MDPRLVPITRKLGEIASLLREGGYADAAADIEKLQQHSRSTDPGMQELFGARITRDNSYWLAMGSIADISFQDRALNRRFVQAYADLAVACEFAGLGSITPGMWLRSLGNGYAMERSNCGMQRTPGSNEATFPECIFAGRAADAAIRYAAYSEVRGGRDAVPR